jgi:hypothetical protein
MRDYTSYESLLEGLKKTVRIWTSCLVEETSPVRRSYLAPKSLVSCTHHIVSSRQRLLCSILFFIIFKLESFIAQTRKMVCWMLRARIPIPCTRHLDASAPTDLQHILHVETLMTEIAH